eukprot:m.8539 g.8539  ORF g.8539 m.8539 type:complete len:87 (-) comp3177_c0_seq1:52-312(-)
METTVYKMSEEDSFNVDDSTWEKDQQFFSSFLEAKDLESGKLQAYISSHPELRNLLSDFLQHILVHKPEDVKAEAKEFFEQYKQES